MANQRSEPIYCNRDHVKAVWCINPTEDRALFVEEFQKSGVPTTALSSGTDGFQVISGVSLYCILGW